MDTDHERYPREVGKSVVTREFIAAGYATKYQNWLFETHSDELTGRVLDIGAGGNQRARYELPRANIEEYIALDFLSNDGITARANATALPLRDESVNTVILREVLEHIPVGAIEPVLSEVHRVLVRGGKLFLTTPFRFQIHGIGYADTLRLTADGLRDVLERVGFDDLRIYKGGGFTESILSPLQTAWSMITEKVELESLSCLFALLHYPAILMGMLAAQLLTAVLGENVFSKTYYLHNMAVAQK